MMPLLLPLEEEDGRRLESESNNNNDTKDYVTCLTCKSAYEAIIVCGITVTSEGHSS